MENKNSKQREEKTRESQQKLSKRFSDDVVRDRKMRSCMGSGYMVTIPNMVYDISDPIISDMSLWGNDLSDHVSLPPLSVQGDKPRYKTFVKIGDVNLFKKDKLVDKPFVKKEEERKIGLQSKDKSGCCGIL